MPVFLAQIQPVLIQEKEFAHARKLYWFIVEPSKSPFKFLNSVCIRERSCFGNELKRRMSPHFSVSWRVYLGIRRLCNACPSVWRLFHRFSLLIFPSFIENWHSAFLRRKFHLSQAPCAPKSTGWSVKFESNFNQWVSVSRLWAEFYRYGQSNIVLYFPRFTIRYHIRN